MEWLYRTRKTPCRSWYAMYRCECGNEWEAREPDVRRGRIKSCGCSMKGCKNALKHGLSGTPTYFSWRMMKYRCVNPKCKDYHRYGGRGITYDPRWEEFEAFLEDMGESPGKGYSLDKIDNDGNYCKDNCQWLTVSANSKKGARR